MKHLLLLSILVGFAGILTIHEAYSITLGMSSERMLETQEIILLGRVVSVDEKRTENKYAISVTKYIKAPQEFQKSESIQAVGCGEYTVGGCITFDKGGQVLFVLNEKDETLRVSSLSFASPNPTCTIDDLFRYNDQKFGGLSVYQGSEDNPYIYTNQPITVQYYQFNKDLEAKPINVTLRVVDDFPDTLKEETITLELKECHPYAKTKMEFTTDSEGTVFVYANVEGDGGGGFTRVEVIDYVALPLQQYQSGIPFNEIQCKENLVLLQKYDGSPACVTEETSEELTKRNWGISDKLLSLMIEKSDDIVTVMVAGEENLSNGNRNVWLSSYEWLKSGLYDEEQLFLEQSKTSPARQVEFSRGEEVLLFLKDVDEKRGAYDLTSAEILPQKYPIKLRDRIANMVNASYDQQKTEDDYADNDRCIKKEFSGDAYWHCSSPKVSFVIPIEITVDKIRDKMLNHVSQSYLDEHFNLVSTGDRIVVNGKETPVGQYLRFIYSIDGLNFRYDVSTKLEKEFDEVYLRFTPPKEIYSIIHDTQKIDELIYSCLDPNTYKILRQPYRVANHAEDGFSPFLAGHSPPTVRDRWGDDPIQRSEKTFLLWLTNGEVECKESRGEFVPDKIARANEVLLIDSIEFNRLKEN